MIINFECQECGSSQITESDGFFVCQGCGLTVDAPVIQYNMGSFKTDKKGNSIQANALLLNGTQIGTRAERKFKKNHINFARLEKINRSLSSDEKGEARAIFNTLISNSGMAANIDLFMDAFTKIFPTIKKHTMSRNLPLFCTTIYYIVMTQQLKNISLKSLLAEQCIDHREFFICVKAVFNELPDLFKERAETMGVMVGQSISKVCDDLKLSSEVRRIAFKISDVFGSRLGFKSRIIAASSVSIAIRILASENSASVLQISECLEITASTVYFHIKSVKIDILKQKYQQYLNNLNNPVHASIIKETIQEKSNNLNAEVLIEDQKPMKSIDIQVPIPIISKIRKADKIEKRRTSEFISRNKEIFTKFIPNSAYLGCFGIPIKEDGFMRISKNLELTNEPVIFTEFEFSPPIS